MDEKHIGRPSTNFKPKTEKRSKTILISPVVSNAKNMSRSTSLDSWERDCFANAIQKNIEYIVGDVIFRSELPDLLVQDNCLSADECNNITSVFQEKDQIRQLICIIIGKDLSILTTFVHHISQIGYRYIADKIYATFSKNKSGELIPRKICTYTLLKDNVDIKLVCDRLWAYQAISDGLYRKIAYCINPIGSQGELWTSLFRELNNISNDKMREEAYVQLKSVLSDEHYMHIASEFDSCVMDISTLDTHSHKCEGNIVASLSVRMPGR